MDNFHIEGSDYIPQVTFDGDTKTFHWNDKEQSAHSYTAEFIGPIYHFLDSTYFKKGIKIHFILISKEPFFVLNLFWKFNARWADYMLSLDLRDAYLSPSERTRIEREFPHCKIIFPSK